MVLYSCFFFCYLSLSLSLSLSLQTFRNMFCYHSYKFFLYNITTGLWVYESLTVGTTAL
jgi:hypothetical protein